VQAEDRDSFARALIDLADRLTRPPDELSAMLAAARLLAQRHFWPTVVADLVKLYRSEIEQREGRPTARMRGSAR
jgi:glycosyltransferase involved in cell wall biosynthesis